MIRFPMTVRGAQLLRDELHNLKTVVRPKIINAISEARAHGDLRENAEYHAAKEQQGFTEGRIAEIEEQLSKAQVIDTKNLNATGRIVFGATVELVNVNTGDEVRYQIVGEMEASVESGMISITSPIARALIGKEEGDVVTVVAPGGEMDYEILSVVYI